MLNLTVMTGRLANDPELRYTPNETPVTNFSIAVRRDYAKKGEEAATDFFDVAAFRYTAEFIYNYFKKGSMIQIFGHFENRKWTDKHDQNRVSIELVAEKAYFGEGKRKEAESGDSLPFDGNADRGSAFLPLPGELPDFDPFR